MDKFKQKEMMKRRPLQESTWCGRYDRLINYILEPKKKTMAGVKEKIMSFLKTNTTKGYS